jgi:hypothetical protein
VWRRNDQTPALRRFVQLLGRKAGRPVSTHEA